MKKIYSENLSFTIQRNLLKRKTSSSKDRNDWIAKVFNGLDMQNLNASLQGGFISQKQQPCI